MSLVGGLLPLVGHQVLLVENDKKGNSQYSIKRKNPCGGSKIKKDNFDFWKRKQTLTCFLSTDCELFAREAAANLVVRVHADAVNTSGV